jgi:hypothetical protein
VYITACEEQDLNETANNTKADQLKCVIVAEGFVTTFFRVSTGQRLVTPYCAIRLKTLSGDAAGIVEKNSAHFAALACFRLF